MVIKQNSNVITIRLIRQYIDNRMKSLEKLWEATYDNSELFNEHCVCIGRIRELEEFSRWFKEVHEVNEDS